MITENIVTRLQSALNEKDTENTWRGLITALFPDGITTSPYNTDGLLETSDGLVSVLMEFKYNQNLKSKLVQVTILSQVLYYLKKFEVNGRELPKCVFIGDNDECFAIHSNPLVKYLSYDLDWNVAASTAFRVNTSLIQEMLDDDSINPFVFEIKPGFVFKAIHRRIVDLSNNVEKLIKITESNICNVFEYFSKNVLGKNSLNVNETANLFVNLIINHEDHYLHPRRKNILVTKSFGDVYVNTQMYTSFFDHYDGEQYSIREKQSLTAIVDRIVEDQTRRRKGEFFTPPNWVEEAHRRVALEFGEDWKERYIVWDCASGTMNLTRDYKFKELYCSTIEESDLKTANQMKYNPESIKFEYDFLNDGIVDGKFITDSDLKMPEGLKVALNGGKEIIILINPPYGTANNAGTDSGHKSGIALTNVNKMMKDEEWGSASQQLYAQFLYRIVKLNKGNIRLCLFSPPAFLSGGSYKEFRKNFLNSFGFLGGFLMNASEFDGTSDWGLSFTMWGESNQIESDFTLNVVRSDSFGNINHLFDKTIYNTDSSVEASKWIKEDLKGLKTFDYPQLYGPLKLRETTKTKNIENALGYMHNNSNNVYYNPTMVGIYTTTFASGHGVPINRDNLFKITSLYTSRKSIVSNWINQKDEYLSPNESDDRFESFKYDSLVYSLFNSSSNQSSMRQISYKGKLLDIKNEFFWMSKDELKSLSESKYFDDIYRDTQSCDERLIYKILYKEGLYEKLSPDARGILDMATALVVKSFDMRKVLHNDKPEYHLNTWDAGWYQIKLILKQFYQDDLRDFTKKYKEFEDRMRPLVYELGFLRK